MAFLARVDGSRKAKTGEERELDWEEQGEEKRGEKWRNMDSKGARKVAEGQPATLAERSGVVRLPRRLLSLCCGSATWAVLPKYYVPPRRASRGRAEGCGSIATERNSWDPRMPERVSA